MLLLLFQLGDDRYALDASQVVEVMPLVAIIPTPQTPAAVAGVVVYRGSPIPAIDLVQLTIGRSASSCLSTRIVVVHYPDADGDNRLLALIAEKVTETVRRDSGDFIASGVSNPNTPYLGPVARDERGLTRWMDLRHVLPDSVRGVLFKKEPAL